MSNKIFTCETCKIKTDEICPNCRCMKCHGKVNCGKSKCIGFITIEI